MSDSAEELLDRLKFDTPFYAENCVRIIPKDKSLGPQPLVPNAGQLAFDRAISEQREAGKPMRAIVLKARQIGFSTWLQAKLIQRTTLHGHQNALVVAHDKDSAGKLFAIGEGMYSRLPNDELIKPPTRYHARATMLHFAPPERDAWLQGDMFPDSTYFVDTANEVQGGRGSTFDFLHLSELAFWADPLTKLAALLQTVPETPNSLIVIESTANGYNALKDLWDQAERGESEFLPFFWPWWLEPSYSLAFADDASREEFKRKLGSGPYGEEEPELLDPGPPHPRTGERVPLTLEQLHWRRATIANKCQGRLEIFDQEYPTTPEHAFIASGRQVFDSKAVRQILVNCDVTDPDPPSTDGYPAAQVGHFEAGNYRRATDRIGGAIDIPESPLWVPRQGISTEVPWRLWVPGQGGHKIDSQYIVSVDVAGGLIPEGSTDPDFSAICVIDHKTREQVAEYASRVDADVLAQQVLLVAKYFKDAWVVVEVTGGWGVPVVRRILYDYAYPYVYRRRKQDTFSERMQDRLGWSTDRATKPLMESTGQEMVREGSHGIRSRGLCLEMLSYVKDDKGKTGAEPGKHDDLVIAWLIAQQSANELPLKWETDTNRR